MEPASFIDPVALQQKAEEHSASLKEKLTEIMADPKKTLYLMLALAFLVAVIFIVFVTVTQILSANSQVSKTRDQKQANSLLTEQVDDSPEFDQQRKHDIEQINQAINAYRSQNGHFPASLSVLIPDYLGVEVSDPQSGQEYHYQPTVNLESYELWGVLSDGQEYRRGGS